MAAPENTSRHYYEHPNHSTKVEVADFYANPAHVMDINGVGAGGLHDGRGRHEQLRAGVTDTSTDSFYRAKLREGFVDLRNSYHQRQRQNQRAPRPGAQNPNYNNGQPPPQTRNGRNGATEGSRPLSMHATTTAGYPPYGGSREHDYGTTSSRGSSDSYHGFPSHPQQPLFRSSSDLHLDNSSLGVHELHPLRREFGSADLVEAKQAAGYANSTDAEFFKMLRSYKADNADQRAPAPPGIHSVLRGESEADSNTTHSTPSKHILQSSNHPQSLQVQLYQPKQTPALPQYGQQHQPGKQHPIHVPQPHQQAFTPASIPLSSNDGVQQAASPPSHQSLEMIKRSPKANKKGQRPRSGDVSALLRKLRPTKGEADGGGRAGEMSSDPHISGLLSEILPEERIRKKAFVHYDCQSVGINFVEAAMKRQNTQIGNTKTGASAASNLDELGEEEPSHLQYNRSTSQLVSQCPAFLNETGAEEERNVALSRLTAQKRVQQVITGGVNGPHALSDIHRSPICNGLSILDGLPGADNRQSLVEKHRGVYILEYRDRGCTYYRQHFRHTEHQNYFGIDENVGPVAISIKREKVLPNMRLTDPFLRQPSSAESSKHVEPTLQQYRVIVRTSELRVLRGVILEDALPGAARLSNSSRGLPAKDIIEYVAPEIQISTLKQATNEDKTKDQILALDEQGRSDSYKVGIMYCKTGQSTEEEMYNNELSGPAFTEFLDLIGRKIELKGFDNFKGGLDNKTDTTGAYSYYTTCQAHEIMFHVSTLLPFDTDRQQLCRKRHIGNDIVTVVFQEPGSLPFDVTSVRSHFQHVFIIVRVHEPNTDNTSYSVAVTRSKDVPSFGPPISQTNYLHGAEFADFLIAKILNAENASYLSDKFQAMAVRTRGEYMKDLATNYVTGNSLDSSSKLAKFSLSGKKKEKKLGKVIPDVLPRGGLVWPTQLEDFGLSCLVDVYLVISADIIAVVEMDTLEIIFTCWCSSVIGWTNTQSQDQNSGSGLRVYFNQGDCILIKPIDVEDTTEIIDRLRIVTLGCETEEMLLQRNENGQLGFHVHMEGIVSDVELHGYAWRMGLRTGSRLVEICKVSMATLTHEQMIDLLRNSSPVKITAIAPVSEGKPRRSLDEKSSDYYAIYPTEDHRLRPLSAAHQNIDGEESSAYFSDDEISPQSTVMSVAKRVHTSAHTTVTLRSSSSGGSSCSPGSTLSGKHKHNDRRAQSDNEHQHHRHHIHSRAKSQDQNYSDTESITQRRPPAGPVYTPPQSQYSVPTTIVPYYQSSHHSSPPESIHSQKHDSQGRPTAAVNGARRAAKDWRHVEPPRLANKQTNYNKLGGDNRLGLSGSQEVLAKHSGSSSNQYNNRPAGNYPGSRSRYSNLDGGHFNKNLQRTFSDESLQSPSRRIASPVNLYSSQPRKVLHELPVVRPMGRPRTGSIPLDRLDADNTEEDLDWSRLVSTASKAIESEPPSTSRSHDSSTDRDNSSVLSGNSTPTQDRTKDLETRCRLLEHELQNERRKSRDMERRLQLEKNRNDDLVKEVNQLRKENSSIRLKPS